MSNVTIYSTPTCVYCKMAKEFFKEKNVSYTEKDVYHDEKAREEMFEKSGQMGVPVIRIESADPSGEKKEEYIVGFQKDKIAAILGIA